jgi:UDP-N-acetylglucosamine 2-epimerase (non-hydrolysing)
MGERRVLAWGVAAVAPRHRCFAVYAADSSVRDPCACGCNISIISCWCKGYTYFIGKMSIGIVFGTRPEYIKCKVLFDNPRYVPIYVNQHADLLRGIEFENVIKIADHGSSNRLSNIICTLLCSDIFKKHWAAIMVQGDTVVAFGAALAAFQCKLPVIHLEAGLRTYDKANPYPEESYRHMIDAIASVGLCPSKSAFDNVNRENPSVSTHIVGNTSIDVIAKYCLTPHIGNKVLVTLHRRENWHLIRGFFSAIEVLALKYPECEFIIPVHPNPDIRAAAADCFHHVRVIEPLDHRALCELLAEANCVISDSGGIQEEASFLGKRIFCCRQKTERNDLLDYLTFTPDPETLLREFEPQTVLLPPCTVYGNGDASLKIESVIESKEWKTE